ncbi:MAG: hypothetical protein J6T10_18250 [Methanobrevibacter sp.]|nr:hypothetical protein [Methanobrevibacter sp.]
MLYQEPFSSSFIKYLKLQYDSFQNSFCKYARLASVQFCASVLTTKLGTFQFLHRFFDIAFINAQIPNVSLYISGSLADCIALSAASDIILVNQ